MDQLTQSQLLQMQNQLPDFWYKQLQENTFIQTLMLSYSYVYGSALQKWQMVQNMASPLTTDAYYTDFYKVIDCHKTVQPSDPSKVNNGCVYFPLPNGMFRVHKLSFQILDFDTISQVFESLLFCIYYDKIKKQTLLEVPLSQVLGHDFLYMYKYDIDNDNMTNTWGGLFLGIRPLNYQAFNDPTIRTNDFGIYWAEDNYGRYIIEGAYGTYMNNIQAQIINFMRCANTSGTIDALESLISIAMNKVYMTTNGTVVNFDSENIWIEANETITQYYVAPKPKFQQANQPIMAFEAPGICPVKFYSWSTDPARFTQALLQNSAANLYNLLSLKSQEEPHALYFDEPDLTFDPADTGYTFDFGVLSSEQSTAITNPITTVLPTLLTPANFTEWSNSTLNAGIFEMFKNVIIYEYDPSKISATWLASILEYFRPLHCKYLPVTISS